MDEREHVRSEYFFLDWKIKKLENEEVTAIHGELDSLEHAKRDLQNRLKLVEELDGRYRTKLEGTVRNEFEHDVEGAYKERQSEAFDKMSKVIAELDSDNHRMRKEFDLMKEKNNNKKSVEDARCMLTDMKIEKLMAQFTEKYMENPAFNDTFCDSEMMNASWKEKNMRDLIANMLTFTLHTGFAKKPVAVKKDVKKR